MWNFPTKQTSSNEYSPSQNENQPQCVLLFHETLDLPHRNFKNCYLQTHNSLITYISNTSSYIATVIA